MATFPLMSLILCAVGASADRVAVVNPVFMQMAVTRSLPRRRRCQWQLSRSAVDVATPVAAAAAVRRR